MNLPALILGNDVASFLAAALLGAATAIVVAVFAFRTFRRQTVTSLLMVAIYCAGSWLLFNVSDDVRSAGRWLLQSGTYKAETGAQRDSRNGELKHVEWDVSGFAGAETVEYLVFDPGDSLRAAAEHHSPGKYRGIPCEVPSVRRLEKHWYVVDFYTDTDWTHCTYPSPGSTPAR